MRPTLLIAAVAVLAVTSCSSGDDGISFSSVDQTTTTAAAAPPSTLPGTDVTVAVDASSTGRTISPLITGISGDLDAAQMGDVGVTINSWGGNPASRFNYQIGHAWNTGADWKFSNTNYGQSGDAARSFVELDRSADVQSRLAVPTLGWIPKDDLESTCSFPDGAGGCLGPDAAGNCESPKLTADPQTANVESDPTMVATWIKGLVDAGLAPEYIALDNEPELWGYTHYDVHPTCTTFQEIFDKYVAYASAVREVAPDAKLAGPVMCCWFDYWHIGPQAPDGSGDDFLTWFLREMKAHDDAGPRLLDVVDVHYYPQGDVFNEKTDDETNARRLRSTKSLWDPTYVDESWIKTRINFIQRMRSTIDATYPGLPLFVSEWNFGADGTMNGALAIADVLGAFGRDGVDAATYWRSPKPQSPGYFAFKMFGNYDSSGSRFGGTVASATSSDVNVVSAYAAVEADTLRVMLVNKDPASAKRVGLAVSGGAVDGGRRFTYGPSAPTGIIADELTSTDVIEVPASSIVLLELPIHA